MFSLRNLVLSLSIYACSSVFAQNPDEQNSGIGDIGLGPSICGITMDLDSVAVFNGSILASGSFVFIWITVLCDEVRIYSPNGEVKCASKDTGAYFVKPGKVLQFVTVKVDLIDERFFRDKVVTKEFRLDVIGRE